MQTHRFAVVLSLLLAAQPIIVRADDTPPVGLSTAQMTTYAQAMQSFREQRYAAAYGRFVRLADAGHAPSAQLALVMYINAPTLFGNHWSATPGQQRRWSALIMAGAGGRIDFDDDRRGE